jgi:hypothetical protein
MENSGYNLFMKMCLDMIRESVPNLFHKCPYDGHNEYFNISLNSAMGFSFSIFPEGQYKYVVTISTEPDKPLMVLSVFTEVKSPLKESFG